ncbi:MAG: hypothetical protein HONDAALG_02525 [Gammaproteobacteria bacterium]|nr:hypothetical protein [Gammaproteobacteria bacterium]
MRALPVALRWWIGAILLLCAAAALAEVPVPPLTARVIDQTGTLSAPEIEALERKLGDFEARKGSQIAVLIVPTTDPETVEQYALRVAEQWKLGRKGVDDGILLLVAKQDRALRIEVGYGLEGAVNDAVASRVIREVIVPLFKHGSYYAGIDAGVDRLMRTVDGEPLPEPDRQRYANESPWPAFIPMAIVLAVIAGPMLHRLFGRVMGSVATGGLTGFFVWLMSAVIGVALAAGVLAGIFSLLFSNMGAGGHRRWSNRGRYSDWGGGWSGGGGGWSGGGFSGGGGSFGGGGASGRW